MGCHDTKQDAIDQALAIAQAEGSEYLGERSTRDLPDNYRPATAEDVPEGRACGNCIFFNEDMLDDEAAPGVNGGRTTFKAGSTATHGRAVNNGRKMTARLHRHHRRTKSLVPM